MKTIYYVDYENVHNFGLAAIKDTKEDDEIIIFLPETKEDNNCTNCIKKYLNEMTDFLASFRFLPYVPGTKNALDFALISYVGYRIHSKEDIKHIIVSNDAGYSPAVFFWQSRNIDIRMKKVEFKGV